ncbi:hypothetical protein PV773_21455 [Mesorhizobium sp. CC13]|uniref:hypothetical protein n=1 Tax=Mesorhizobium sp. CC13 TaxID=3029194 RepID=UPI0032638B69
MPPIDDHDRRADEAEALLRTAVMNGFADAMRKSGLPPMVVLRLAARAVGSVYREAADAHAGPHACGCGWCPQEGTDIDLLCSALLSASARRRHRRDLAAMQVAGRA